MGISTTPEKNSNRIRQGSTPAKWKFQTMHGQGKTVHGVQASELVDDACLISQAVLVVHTSPIVGDLLIVIVGV